MKIAGFSNYEIYPETGQIWSYKTKRYIGTKQPNGYIKCNLRNDNKETIQTNLHRIIWIAVNGEIPDGMQVNHIDENKENNCISNLNLMTCKENINYGTGINRRKNKLSKAVVALKNGKVHLLFPSVQEAGRNGFDARKISACTNNYKWVKTHKGYQWLFYDDWEMYY